MPRLKPALSRRSLLSADVFEIAFPPLRKRLEDLPALVEHLIRRHNLEMKNGVQGGRQRDYADSYVAALER